MKMRLKYPACLLPNLWTLHNDWRNMGVSLNMPAAPVQLDANMGWVNAVQEMLLYVSPKLVKLLPALPAKWRRGKAENWRFCTGRVTMEWDLDSGRFAAELFAERETSIVLRLPEQFPSCTFSGEGQYRLENMDGKSRYKVNMSKGAALSVRNGV